MFPFKKFRKVKKIVEKNRTFQQTSFRFLSDEKAGK